MAAQDARIEELRSVLQEQGDHVADEFRNVNLKLLSKIDNLEQCNERHFAHFTEACAGKCQAASD